jgi:hypothetical protein
MDISRKLNKKQKHHCAMERTTDTHQSMPRCGFVHSSNQEINLNAKNKARYADLDSGFI